MFIIQNWMRYSSRDNIFEHKYYCGPKTSLSSYLYTNFCIPIYSLARYIYLSVYTIHIRAYIWTNKWYARFLVCIFFIWIEGGLYRIPLACVLLFFMFNCEYKIDIYACMYICDIIRMNAWVRVMDMYEVASLSHMHAPRPSTRTHTHTYTSTDRNIHNITFWLSP